MRLNDFMEDSHIPKDTLRMVKNLPLYGKEALDNYLNEKSDFSKSSSLGNIFKNFSYDTSSKDDFYHYTTVNSLKKIVKSKTWLIKQINFMNDPEEFKYTVQLGIKYLNELDATADEISSFEKDFRNSPFNDLYVWSFTKNRSSQTLFGNYSGNKDGVALKFDVDNLQRTLATHFSNGKDDLNNFSAGDAYVFPLRATYDKDAQKKYLYPIIQEWLFAQRCIKEDPDDMNRIILVCIKTIKIFAMCFKNPILRQEEEIRFVIVNINNDMEIHPDILVNDTPFVKVEIDNNLIKEAILQTGNAVTTEELKSFLLGNGFKNVKVSRSELPY